jgi:hypothetical protein
MGHNGWTRTPEDLAALTQQIIDLRPMATDKIAKQLGIGKQLCARLAREAGVEVRATRPHRNDGGVMKAEVLRLWRQRDPALTTREISQQTGCSYSGVTGIIFRAGETHREIGPVRRPRARTERNRAPPVVPYEFATPQPPKPPPIPDFVGVDSEDGCQWPGCKVNGIQLVCGAPPASRKVVYCEAHLAKSKGK